MGLYSTATPGEKKLELDGFTFYYNSADDPKNPNRDDGIEDDIARDVAAEFIERCGGSTMQSGAQLVRMKHEGGIRHATDSGSHFFHLKRKHSLQGVFYIVK